MAPPIRVLIADDHEIYRLGLRAVLELEPDIEVVGEAADGDIAHQLALSTRPDVILMDVRMGPTNGIDSCRMVKSELPEVGVLMLTSFGEHQAVLASLLAGAAGYLLKTRSRADVVRAIRTVAAGDTPLDPSITRDLTSRLIELSVNAEDPRIASLNERERQVLRLIADGKTNKEIALALGIRTPTARGYVSSMLEKLSLHSRVEAATFWTEIRLGSPSEA